MAEPDPTLEGADNPERPEWLPENFETPEDLVKSQAEAQRKITEQGQALAEERRAREALEESIQTLSAQFEAQNRPDPNTVNEYWQNQYDMDPLGTMTQIAQATAQQILQQQAQQNQQPAVSPEVVSFMADQTMNQRHEDWSEYREKVGELIAANPLFQDDRLWGDPQTASSTMNSAYQMVKAEAVLSGNDVVQQQAADTRAMKLAAQSAAGTSGRTPASPEDEWAQVMNFKEKRYYE